MIVVINYFVAVHHASIISLYLHNSCYITHLGMIAERISARQYKSGSILGIYVCVRTFGHLRRRRRLDVYARARIQYRLGACKTRFIAGSSERNVTRVCVRVHMHACVRGSDVYACTHA